MMGRLLCRVIYPVVFLLIVCGVTGFVSCRETTVPKPYGYFRIALPEKGYQQLGNGYPYRFEIPLYSEVVTGQPALSEPYWITISVPFCKAEIHISYKAVGGNLPAFTEESRKLAYEHTLKASSIDEQLFFNPRKRVFGTIYHINGNAASPMQFYLTDSTAHFIRGSLYIRATPNIDSLKPVIAFLKEDINRLIETCSWGE